MSVIEQMTEAQDRVLRGMEAAQDQMIDMNRRAAEAMTNILPEGDRFSSPSLPVVDSLPKPDEFIDRYFDFTAKLAEANRSFYKEMVAVWAPVEDDTASPKGSQSKGKQSKGSQSKGSPSKGKQSKKATA